MLLFRLARCRSAAIALTLSLCAFAGPSGAQALGPVTGLPLPRYVSLKTDRVNLREGPSKDHATLWVYQRIGLPVEVTAEFETWLKVRDWEGAEGWVLHSLVSGRRTSIIGSGKKGRVFSIYAKASEAADLAASLQSGVISAVKSCDGKWCLVEGDGYKGYAAQINLWGVYPDEKFE